MRLYLSGCACIRMTHFFCLYLSEHVCVQLYGFVCTCISTSINLYVDVGACLHLYVPICTCLYVYVPMGLLWHTALWCFVRVCVSVHVSYLHVPACFCLCLWTYVVMRACVCVPVCTCGQLHVHVPAGLQWVLDASGPTSQAHHKKAWRAIDVEWLGTHRLIYWAKGKPRAIRVWARQGREYMICSVRFVLLLICMHAALGPIVFSTPGSG